MIHDGVNTVNHKSYNSGSAARKESEDKLVRALTTMDKKIDRKKKRRFAPIGDSRSLNYLREIERVARLRLDRAEHGARIKRVGRLHRRSSSARRRVL